MYLSVFMGPFARGPMDDVKLIDQCLEQAVAADRAGFAMVTFGEQHFKNYEPYCNPLMMAARLSGELRQAYFGTTICPLPLHSPVRLAEDTNIADVLLRGRMVLGVSAGRVGFSSDFENFGLDPAQRDALFATKLDLLLQLWTHRLGDPPITYDTGFDKGEMLGRLMPMSYRAGRPLLAVGTNTDATIAKIGSQGLPVFLGPCTVDEAGRKLKIHAEALAASSQDARTVQLATRHSFVLHHVIVAETDDEAWARVDRMVGMVPLLDRSNDSRSFREMCQVDLASEAGRADRNAQHAQSWILAGSPDSVLRQLKAHQAVGVNHVHTRFMVGRYNPVDVDASFKLFVEEVMPKLDVQTFPGLEPDEVQPFYKEPADMGQAA